MTHQHLRRYPNLTAYETALFDVPVPPVPEVNYAAGEDLRVQIHQHLRRHPMLTAYELARALHLPCPQGGGQDKVRRQLRIMAEDGEADGVTGVRAAGDRRAAVRWVAT